MKILLFSILFVLVHSAVGDDIFIDKGACPGEGCLYPEEWMVLSEVKVYAEPDMNSALITVLEQGAKLTTITGEVHTIPGKFIVKKLAKAFKPGDEVWLYTYLGEGRFKLKHNEEIVIADLNFSPIGEAPSNRCAHNSTRCFGELSAELKFTWWVNIETQAKVQGWIAYGPNLQRPVQ